MGEVVRGETRREDLELAIRIKRGEAHTHDQLADGFEKRAADHRGYAEDYRREIGVLEAQLYDFDREEVPLTAIGDGCLRMVEQCAAEIESMGIEITGPEESFS